MLKHVTVRKVHILVHKCEHCMLTAEFPAHLVQVTFDDYSYCTLLFEMSATRGKGLYLRLINYQLSYIENAEFVLL